MICIETTALVFRIKDVFLAEQPIDVDNCHVVNFIGCPSMVDVKGFSRTSALTSVIDLGQDLDTLFSHMDKKSTRYEIKRAEKDGLKIDINHGYEEFCEMHRRLQQTKGFAPVFGVKNKTSKLMRRHGTLFTARYEDDILVGHLYLEDEHRMRLWLSASRRLEVDRDKAALIGRANRLTHWEAMKYAKAKGISLFDWGGLWSEKEANNDRAKHNINSFKLSFGGEVVPVLDYRRVYSRSYRFALLVYATAGRCGFLRR